MNAADHRLPRVPLTADYSVQRAIVGCWQLAGGHGRIDPAAALANLTRYVEAGFYTFDCADIYTGVEQLLGRLRQQCRRRLGGLADEIKVHTKFVPDRDQLQKIDKRYVQTIIDRSLDRLQAEQLDLVQFHWWDLHTPGYVETAQMLAELQSQGKIAHIGLTNFDVAQVAEIVDAGVAVVSNQVQWSLCDGRPAKAMSAAAARSGFHLLCYGTLAGGLISERYLGAARPRDPLENRSLAKYLLMVDEIGGWDAFQNVLRTVSRIAGKHQESMANVAARFVLDQERVAAVIIGARDSAHLADTHRLFEIELDEDDRASLRGALADLSPLSGGVYELERRTEGRHAAIMKYNLNAAND